MDASVFTETATRIVAATMVRNAFTITSIDASGDDLDVAGRDARRSNIAAVPLAGKKNAHKLR